MPSTPQTITHIGTNTASNPEGGSGTGTLTVAVPAGTQNGDLLIMSIYNSQAGSTEEGSWTQLYEINVSTTLRARVLWRIASSEPADYDVVRGSGNTWGVSISSFRGVNQSSPINISANSLTTHGSPPLSITAPNVTTTVPDCKIVTVLATRSGTTAEATFSSGDLQLADWGFDNGTNPRNGYLAFSTAKSQGTVTGLTMTRDSGSVTAAVAFTIALTPATSYTESPSDTATLNDAGLEQSVTRTGNVVGIVRLSDSVTTELTTAENFEENVSDVVTLSDEVETLVIHNYVENASDTVTLSDSASPVQSTVINLSDTATLNDGPQNFSYDYVGQASSVETLSDSVETSLEETNDRNFSDDESLTDSVEISHTAIGGLDDIETLSDSVTVALAVTQTFTDTETLDDTANPAVVLLESASDTVTLSDTTTQTSEYQRDLSDTETLSDSATSVSSYVRDFSDTSTLSDEVTAGSNEPPEPDDLLTLSDSISTTLTGPDDSGEIGNYTTTLVLGPASIYVGDFGATEPEGVEILSEPNGEWVNLGGTLEGVEVSVAQEYEETNFEQIPEMPMRRLKRRRLDAKTVLAEPTLQNILYGLNGGVLDTGSGYESYTPADMDEATELDYRAVMLYGWAPGEGSGGGHKRRVVIMRKCLSIENVEMSYKKEDQTGLSVTWGVHRVDDSTPPFLIIDEA